MLMRANVVAIVSMTIVLCYQAANFAASQGLIDIDLLFNQAKKLESAVAVRSADNSERTDLLFRFLTQKNSVCDDYYAKVTNVIDEYRMRATELVNPQQKQSGNWFAMLGNVFVSPLNSMKQLSKNYNHLRDATERYAADPKQVKMEDVECDLAEFQVDALNKIVFVLQTYVKYLITEQSYLARRAIWKYIVRSNFESDHNYYKIKGPNDKQMQLLKQFFIERTNRHQKTVGDAADHFETPSSLVYGSLTNSCTFLLKYADKMAAMKPERDDKCKVSTMAKARFDVKEVRSLADKRVGKFCKEFVQEFK